MRIERRGRPDKKNETKDITPEKLIKGGELPLQGEIFPSKKRSKHHGFHLFQRTPETLEDSIAHTPLEGDPEKNASILRLIADFREQEAEGIAALKNLGVSDKKIQGLLKTSDEKTHSG